MRPSRFLAFIFSILFVTGVAVLFVTGVAAAADPLAIEGLRTGINAGKTRLVIDLDRPADFRAFVIDAPPRLIVDLPEARWKTAAHRVLTDATLKGYRSGKLDDSLTRIVFDMRKTAVIAEAFTLPKTSTAKNRLVIDLKTASKNAFAAADKKVYGNPDIRKTASRPATDIGRTQAIRTPAAQKEKEEDAPPPRIVRAGDTRTAGKSVPLPQPKPYFSDTRGAARKLTVVIDAGHGGKDAGAVGKGGVYEKDIVLQVARELKRQMEETGRYRVVMTRDSDHYIRLYERVDLSRKEKADLFVSIHADKIARDGVRGASIYTLSTTASDAETERLAEQENNAGIVAGVDLAAESPDVAGILLDLAMREKMNESNLLARYIVDHLQRENIRLLPNSHRSAGFAVLKAPDVPAVLIETGFLSNPEEAKLLSSAAFQRKISAAILAGIDAYFRKIQSLQKL